MNQRYAFAALDILLFRRNAAGERQNALAAELGISSSRVSQRIERAKRFARGPSTWARSTPEDVYWETVAADGLEVTAAYEAWRSPITDSYVHESAAFR